MQKKCKKCTVPAAHISLNSFFIGISPPSKRDEDDFDPGAIFHVAADYTYIRYFNAYIYQFQFYRALCLESGQYLPGDPSKPLHRCNFYGSKRAGRMLFEMLEMGASRPWKEVMESMTGDRGLNTRAFREYFKYRNIISCRLQNYQTFSFSHANPQAPGGLVNRREQEERSQGGVDGAGLREVLQRGGERNDELGSFGTQPVYIYESQLLVYR